MMPYIPVWIGGRIILDAISKKETYLNFEPNYIMTYDGVKYIEKGVPIPLFEICAYSEHEHLLVKEWKNKMASVKSLFSECVMYSEGELVKMAPTQTHGEGRHNLDWQMFQQFRCIGRKKVC